MRQHRRAECIFGENFEQGLKECILTVYSMQQRECSRADQPACVCAPWADAISLSKVCLQDQYWHWT